MGIASKARQRTGKRHVARVEKNTRSAKDVELIALAKKGKHNGTMRKLDLKKRGARVREWQVHMEAAREDCVRRGIGAVKYLSPANRHAQLPGCPLTMKDKSRLAANLKSGNTPRRGEHMQHLTDAEVDRIAAEMTKSANEERSLEGAVEVVAGTIANCPNGPAGRTFTRAVDRIDKQFHAVYDKRKVVYMKAK
jgi:hypothetical protein